MIPTSSQSIRVAAIVGPTASGKTELAEKLALLLDGEVISADSMQVYRGMDIGTAKPRASERRARYWCLDLVEVGEPFSAALYQREARRAITDISHRDKLPIIAGGTGLYVRAALDDMQFPDGQQIANPVRQHYEDYASEHGSEALHALLASRDPESADLIHPNNVRRVVRALEMLDRDTSYAQQHRRFSARESVYDARFVGLTMDRRELNRRIDARVDAMMASGLLEEVCALLEAGFRDALTSAQAIGYKEFVPVLEEGEHLEEAVEAVKQATRRYAKRQLTWFRADPRVHWIDVTSLSPDETAEAALRALDWETR